MDGVTTPTREELEAAVRASQDDMFVLLDGWFKESGVMPGGALKRIAAYGDASQALGEHIGREAEAKQIEAADALALTVWEQIEDLAGVHAIECAVLTGDHCDCMVLRAVEFLTAEFETYERSRPEPFEVQGAEQEGGCDG